VKSRVGEGSTFEFTLRLPFDVSPELRPTELVITEG
jgi:hypothetical protein